MSPSTALRSMNAETCSQLLLEFAKVIRGVAKQAWRNTSSQHLCDPADVVQAAHIAIFMRSDRIVSARNRRAMVVKVTHDASIDFLRQQRRQSLPTIDLSHTEAA